MTDSETEWMTKYRTTSGGAPRDETSSFEQKIIKHIRATGALSWQEVADLSEKDEKTCRAIVNQSTRLRMTSEGKVTLVKAKHKGPLARRPAAGLGMPPSTSGIALPVGAEESDTPPGRVGYSCLAEEFQLAGMQKHYEGQGFSTSLKYGVLRVTDLQGEQQTSQRSPSEQQQQTIGTGGTLKDRREESKKGDSNTRNNGRHFQLFVFEYGAIVIWAYNQQQYERVEQDFTLASNSKLSPFISGRYPAAVVRDAGFPVWMSFSKDSRTGKDPSEPDQKFSDNLQYDHFSIPNNSVDLELCVSHALAQSAKIDYIEIKVDELTKSCKPLPRELKDKGSVTISERKLLQLRGEVLFYRLMLKSGSDLLDEPELFWECPWLKPFYNITKTFFDITERVETLDAKLEAGNQIVTMIGDQFNQRHGSRLEWIVIWLVMVEVVIGLLELVLDIKPWAQ